GDVARENSEMRHMILENQRRTDQIQRAVENLQRQVEDPRGRGGGDRVAALEKRVADLEDEAGRGDSGSVGSEGSETTPPPPAAAPTPTTPPPPPSAAAPAADASDGWSQDVAKEQAAVNGTNLREKADFLAILDALGKRDCNKAIPQLNAFAAATKDSPLADAALIWAAGCYQLRGDRKQATPRSTLASTAFPNG